MINENEEFCAKKKLTLEDTQILFLTQTWALTYFFAPNQDFKWKSIREESCYSQCGGEEWWSQQNTSVYGRNVNLF